MLNKKAIANSATGQRNAALRQAQIRCAQLPTLKLGSFIIPALIKTT